MGSLYSDYNQIAQVYDASRVPIGIDFIAQLIKPDHHILDVGCGTGNYIRRIAPVVKKVTGIDYNEEMLKRAKQKVINMKNVDLVRGSLMDKLPFEDNTFDLILINQVLHHLDSDVDNFPNTSKFLSEIFRVMRPSGVVCINTCTPEQVNGFWYIDTIPRVKEEFKKRYMTLNKMGEMLAGSGFTNRFKAVAFPEPLQGVKYFNLLGPLDNTWRLADSKWQLATKDEVEQAQSDLIELLKMGKLGNYFDEKDKFRRDKGQTTFIVGQKGELQVTGIKANSDNIKVI